MKRKYHQRVANTFSEYEKLRGLKYEADYKPTYNPRYQPAPSARPLGADEGAGKSNKT